jgi:hypothetical protein
MQEQLKTNKYGYNNMVLGAIWKKTSKSMTIKIARVCFFKLHEKLYILLLLIRICEKYAEANL